MQTPGKILGPRTQPNGAGPLPLFRPEAIANQQQKSYGQIILIRPLSLVVLTWLAIAIVAASAGFIVFGHYTEKVRLSGSILPPSSNADGSTVENLRAELYVPGRWLALVQPGKSLPLHCLDCPPPLAEQTGTVFSISEAPVDSPKLTAESTLLGPQYKVSVSLPPQTAQTAGLIHPPQTGMKVEAQIPLGRKPLIKWFFERSGS